MQRRSLSIFCRLGARQADFSGALIAHGGLLAGCQKTLTFDQAAADVPGMQLLATTML